MANLKVYLTAETKKFQRGLKRASYKLKKFGRNVRRYSALAGAAITAFGLKSIQMFGQQEDAERSLISAMVSNGDAAEKLFPKFNQLASAIQKQTKIGDEAALSMMAQIRNLGVMPNQMEQATKGAIGLAQALQLDANSAARYSALAIAGEYTILQRYVPALRTATSEAEKQAIVLDLMNKGYEQAKNQARTTAGRLVQLKNAFGDVTESIGLLLSNIFNIRSESAGLTNTLLEWSNTIRKNAPELAYAMRSVFFDVQTNLNIIIEHTKFWISLFRENLPDAARYGAKVAGEEIKLQIESALADTKWGKMIGIVKTPIDALVGAGKDILLLWSMVGKESRENLNLLVQASDMPAKFKKLTAGGKIKEAFKFMLDKGMMAEFRDELIGVGKQFREQIEASLDLDPKLDKLNSTVNALKKAREDLDEQEVERLAAQRNRLEQMIKDAKDMQDVVKPALLGTLKDVAKSAFDWGMNLWDAADKKTKPMPDMQQDRETLSDKFLRIGGIVSGQAGRDRDTDYLRKQTTLQERMTAHLENIANNSGATPRFT